MNTGEAWSRLTESRFGVLGTVDAERGTHLIPVVYTPLGDARVFIAIDDKPKRSRQLRRLVNIERNPRVSLLVQHSHSDWTQLWWVRVDGHAAIRSTIEPQVERLHRSRYPQLEGHELGPWIDIAVDAISGWSAA